MGLFDKIIKFAKQVNIIDEFTVKNRFWIDTPEKYQDNYKKVLVRNPKYDTPLSKLKDDIIYEYETVKTFNDVSLIKETETKMIKVEYKGIEMGYVKKGVISRVINLMKEEHKVEICIIGGNAKCSFDTGVGYERYTDNNILRCNITIYTKPKKE